MPQTSASRRSAVSERAQEDTIVSVERAFEIVAMLAVLDEGASLADITWVYAASGAKRSLQIDPSYSLDAYLHTTAIGKCWLRGPDQSHERARARRVQPAGACHG